MANDKNKMIKMGVELDVSTVDAEKQIKNIGKSLDSLAEKKKIEIELENIKGFGELKKQVNSLDTVLSEIRNNSKLAGSDISNGIAKSFKDVLGATENSTKGLDSFLRRLNVIGNNAGINDVSTKVKRLGQDLNNAFKENNVDFKIDIKDLMGQDVEQQVNILANAVNKFGEIWASKFTGVANEINTVTTDVKGLAGAAKEAASGIDELAKTKKLEELKQKVANVREEAEKLRNTFGNIGKKGLEFSRQELKGLDLKEYMRANIKDFNASKKILEDDSSSIDDKREAVIKLTNAVYNLNKVYNSMTRGEIIGASSEKNYNALVKLVDTFKDKYGSDVTKVLEDMQKTSEDLGKEIKSLEVTPQVDINPQPDPDGKKKIEKAVDASVPEKTKASTEVGIDVIPKVEEKISNYRNAKGKDKTQARKDLVATLVELDKIGYSFDAIKEKMSASSKKTFTDALRKEFENLKAQTSTTISEIDKLNQMLGENFVDNDQYIKIFEEVKSGALDAEKAFKLIQEAASSSADGAESSYEKVLDILNQIADKEKEIQSRPEMTNNQEYVGHFAGKYFQNGEDVNDYKEEIKELFDQYREAQKGSKNLDELKSQIAGICVAAQDAGVKLEDVFSKGQLRTINAKNSGIQDLISQWREYENACAPIKNINSRIEVSIIDLRKELLDTARSANLSEDAFRTIVKTLYSIDKTTGTDKIKQIATTIDGLLTGKIEPEITKLKEELNRLYPEKDFGLQYDNIFDEVEHSSINAAQALEQIKQEEDKIAAAAKAREEAQRKANEEDSKAPKTSGGTTTPSSSGTGTGIGGTGDGTSTTTPPATTNTEIQDLERLKAAIIEVEREIALKTRAFNEESVTVTNVVSSELILLEKLRQKIEAIKSAVDEKTGAFTNEQSTVTSVVGAEITKLEELSRQLTQIKADAQSVKVEPSVDVDNTKQIEAAQEKLKGLLQELRTNGVTKGIDESTERTKNQIAQLIIQLEKYGVALDSVLGKKDLTTLNAKKWGINDVVTDLKTPATASIGQEIKLVGDLKAAVDNVEGAVRQKNKAFSEEQTAVKNVVDAEIEDLVRLKKELGIVADATNIKNTALGTESSDNKKTNSKKSTTQNKSNASTSTLSSALGGIDSTLSNLSSAIGALNGKIGTDDRNVTVDGISGISDNVRDIYNILNNQQQQDVNLAKSINSAVEELSRASKGIAEDIQEKKTANEKDAAIKKKTYVREADPQMEAIQGVINTTKKKYNTFSGSNEVDGDLKKQYTDLIEEINKAQLAEEKLSENQALNIENMCRGIQKEINLREQNILITQKQAAQEELAKKYEEKQKALQKSLDDISINGQVDTDGLDKAKKKVAELGEEIGKLRQKDENEQIKILNNNDLAESKANLKELTAEATKLANVAIKDYNKTALSGTYSEQWRKAKKTFDEFENSIKNVSLSSDITAQVNEYRLAIENLEGLQKNLAKKPASQLTTNDKTAWENAKKSVDDYEKSLGKLAKTYQEVQNAQERTSIDTIAPDIKTNDPQQMFDALSKYAEEGIKARVSIGKLNKDQKSLNATFVDSNHKLQQVTVTYDEFTRTVGKSITPMKKVETNWDKLVTSIGRKMREMVAYMASFVSVYEIFGVIRQGVTYVKEIDDALTELKKVTDETDASYNKFLQDMSKTAATIGTTVKDLTSSAADGLIS